MCIATRVGEILFVSYPVQAQWLKIYFYVHIDKKKALPGGGHAGVAHAELGVFDPGLVVVEQRRAVLLLRDHIWVYSIEPPEISILFPWPSRYSTMTWLSSEDIPCSRCLHIELMWSGIHRWYPRTYIPMMPTSLSVICWVIWRGTLEYEADWARTPVMPRIRVMLADPIMTVNPVWFVNARTDWTACAAVLLDRRELKRNILFWWWVAKVEAPGESVYQLFPCCCLRLAGCKGSFDWWTDANKKVRNRGGQFATFVLSPERSRTTPVWECTQLRRPRDCDPPMGAWIEPCSVSVCLSSSQRQQNKKPPKKKKKKEVTSTFVVFSVVFALHPCHQIASLTSHQPSTITAAPFDKPDSTTYHQNKHMAVAKRNRSETKVDPSVLHFAFCWSELAVCCDYGSK